MTGMPTVNPSTLELYEALGPAIIGPDPATGWVLLGWVDGPGHLRDEVASVVRWRAGRAGWQDLLDADRCPAWALPWLAQWVGVDLDPAWSTGQIREAIRTPLSWSRASVGVIRDAANRWLPSGEVVLVEYAGGDEHAITITFDAAQLDTPTLGDLEATYDTLGDIEEAYKRLGDITPAEGRVRDAIAAAVPAWIVATIIIND